MKNYQSITVATLCALATTLGISSCSSSSDSDDNDIVLNDFTEIASVYANKTVIATYANMKSNAADMKTAVTAYKESQTQENLNLAAEAWKRTRRAWECSEAFLFGPADNKNLDPALDSWPLDKVQLDAILSDKTPIKDVQLTNMTSGFHTLEYLLFRDGRSRSYSDLNNLREIEYLEAVANKLYDDTANLHDTWANEYLTTFLKNPTSAMDEMLDGISEIANEVGNGKIADPYKSKNVLEVESWYSWNSLTDFKNNIRSIENAYLGGFDANTRSANLSDFVKSKNADLDIEVRKTIQDAINAINEIPEPFRNQLENPDSDDEINKAMESCRKLMDIFDQKVKTLVVY